MEAYMRARLVDGVTADDDKVAPVYKLDEICKLLEESPPDVVKEVSDYIMQRLARGSPTVKQKALRLIKFAVPKAGREFRRYIQRRSAELKTYFHYRGHPDPLRGDAPNKAVREMAHEAVQAIFTQPEDPRSSASYTGSVEAPTRKKMEGFGNTPVNPPAAKTGAASSQQIGDILGKGIAMISGAAVGGKPGNKGFSYEDEPESRGSYVGPQGGPSDHYDSRYGEHYGRGSGYGDAYGVDRQYDRQDYYSPRDRHHDSAPAEGHSYASDPYSERREAAPEAGRAPAGGLASSPEEKAVEAVTAQGGVRLQPTRDALKDFVAGLGRLHPLLVAQALESRLASPVWQVRLRALCVLEAVLRTQEDAACDEVFAFFVDGPQAVVGCLEHAQASVAEKAKRVLDVLGLRHPDGHAPPSRQPAAQVPDLIDIAEPQAGPAEAGGSTAAAAVDLLGSLSSDQPPPQSAPPPAAAADLLGTAAPAAAGGSAADASDLLGGLTLNGSSAPAGPPAPTAAAAPAADIFGAVELLAPAEGATSAGGAAAGGGAGDLFSGLEVNEEGGVAAVKSLLQQPSGGAALLSGIGAAGMPAAAAGVTGYGLGAATAGMAGYGLAMRPGVQPVVAAPMPCVLPAAGATLQGAGAGFVQTMGMHMPAYHLMPQMMGGIAMPMGGMAMPVAAQAPVVGAGWHGQAGLGAASSLGGAAGPGPSSSGRKPIDFDFSGDATVRVTATKPAAETTKAFDFVMDQMASMSSTKSTSTVSIR